MQHRIYHRLPYLLNLAPPTTHYGVRPPAPKDPYSGLARGVTLPAIQLPRPSDRRPLDKTSQDPSVHFAFPFGSPDLGLVTQLLKSRRSNPTLDLIVPFNN